MLLLLLALLTLLLLLLLLLLCSEPPCCLHVHLTLPESLPKGGTTRHRRWGCCSCRCCRSWTLGRRRAAGRTWSRHRRSLRMLLLRLGSPTATATTPGRR